MADKQIIAIDGEGYSTRSGRHLYTYLAAYLDRSKAFSSVENVKGLGTKQIFDFLLSLPKKALIVGFSLGYDLTKWFEDLRDENIYAIYRPDKRPHFKGRPVPHRVTLGGQLYAVNLISTKLTISTEWDRSKKGWRRTVVVWDLFKFFQRSFVNSLIEWSVGTIDELKAIKKMKDARGSFAGISDREKQYCQSEVRLLSQLCDRLIGACTEAGLILKDYFGAGSLGAAALRNGPAKEQRIDLLKMPKGFRHAVSCAFFGGRFEQSIRGVVQQSHGFDLASAYPYAETQLPCLKCGHWKCVKGSHAKVERAVRKARAACVRYRLTRRSDVSSVSVWNVMGEEALSSMPDGVTEHARASLAPWGPFPFRLKDGSILFPAESGGGWVWHFEALAALDNPHMWPNVQLREAWIYTSKCKCDPPFLEEVSRYYRQRLEWGKEAKGLVLKKGLASRYGKRAQTIGKAPFHCFVAAGLITSHTRSEILRAIGKARSGWDVLSVATDGIITRDILDLRKPNPTNTDTGKGKPLGMWEHKDSGPIFLIRPGMRFAIELKRGKWIPRPEDEKKTTTAARGVGVMKLHAERAQILDAWFAHPGEPTTVKRGSIFHGAKLCVGKTAQGCRRLSRYGRWEQAEPFNVSYLPLPKRPGVMADQRLYTWALTRHEGESTPYKRMIARLSKDILELEYARDEAEAQPDQDEPMMID